MRSWICAGCHRVENNTTDPVVCAWCGGAMKVFGVPHVRRASKPPVITMLQVPTYLERPVHRGQAIVSDDLQVSHGVRHLRTVMMPTPHVEANLYTGGYRLRPTPLNLPQIPPEVD